MRATVVTTALLLTLFAGAGLAVLLRPHPQPILLPPRRLHVARLPSSQARADSLRRVLDSLSAELNGRQLQIGEPSLIVIVPDSTRQRGPLAAVHRQFARRLPYQAGLAARYHLRFYVRPSMGLDVLGPDGLPLRGARVQPGDLGYVFAAPGYPAVRLPGIQSDSALADAAGRYAALIGLRLPSRQPS